MLRDLVIAHLKASVPGLRKVGKAVDLAAAKSDPSKQYPRAYVLPVTESAGPARYMTGAVAQLRKPGIGILLVVRNVRDVTGDAVGTDMDVLRQQVDDAVFGWQPSQTHTEMLYRTGALLGLVEGELWWQDEYTTEYDRRK